MSDDLNRQIFKEEAYDLLTELEGALLELEENSTDMDLVNRVFRALHTIKGSGSMFGFEDIAEFTHEVETVFDMVRNEELPVTSGLVSLAFRTKDQIQKMLDNSESGEPVAPDEMESILLGLQALASGDSPAAPPVEEEFVEEAEFAAPATEGEYFIRASLKEADAFVPTLLDPIFLELRKLGDLELLYVPAAQPAPGEEYWEFRYATKVDVEAIRDIFMFADADFAIEIKDSGSVSGESHPVGPAPDGEIQSEAVVVEESVEVQEPVLAEAFDADDDHGDHDEHDYLDEHGGHYDHDDDELDDDMLMKELEHARSAGRGKRTPGVEHPKLGELLVESGEVTSDDVAQALAQQKPIGQILKEAGKVTDEQVAKAIERQSQAKTVEKPVASDRPKAVQGRGEPASSLRVAADKLDLLVDLVGELVIVQAQISQVVSERSDPILTALAEELERLSDELRDSTLGIRMLPIGTTFSKFRRLVRDLSSDLDKEINLSTNGAETELDKTVIERLSDPLVHLLRNSIDHGIESPADRVAAGKTPDGMILLSAEHSGSEVLIRITDDGRGMDPEKLRAKAVERGLIAADAELSRKDIFKLIFEPGFSTAEKVTNVSGRGVGMDVVKRAIDSLRGTIDIDSVMGKGTTITVRLPLTLAIIDGLQVKVEDGYYVIPLSLVEECVELTNTKTEDENESKQKIMHLRGEIVPYIHLRDWFDIKGENPPIEQIVITGVEGSRIGIVVDTVIGEHQTVIKNLSRVYKDVEGLSGATIKGDGSIALILDVPSLVRRVIAESA